MELMGPDVQAIHQRFSGPVRAFSPRLPGADAWRATTYGHAVLQTNPVGSALDQESPGSISAGAIKVVANLRRRACRDCHRDPNGTATVIRTRTFFVPINPGENRAARVNVRARAGHLRVGSPITSEPW
jgi:hypothetical protein